MIKLTEDYSIKLFDENDDEDKIFALVKAFISESPYAGMEVADDILKDVVSGYLDCDPKEKMAVILLKGEEPIGLLAAIASEGAHPFIKGKIAAELMWYVSPEHRGSKLAPKLLEAFQEWAKVIGASYLSLSSLDDERLDKLYKKMGYEPVEKSYLKWLH